MTTGNTAGNISNGGYAARNKDWIYFSDPGDGYALCRMDVNGRRRAKLCGGSCGSINVIGGWVYFCDDGGLYKVSREGGPAVQLSDYRCGFVNVVDEWICFRAYDTDGGWVYYTDSSHRLRKVSVDGEGDTVINDDFSANINVSGGWVYYSDPSINRIRTDGGGRETVTENPADSIFLAGDLLLYINLGELSVLRDLE